VGGATRQYRPQTRNRPATGPPAKLRIDTLHILAGEVDLAERVLADRLDAAAHSQPLPWTIAMAFRGRGLLATAQGDIANALNQLDRALAVYDMCLAMRFERGLTLTTSERRVAERAAAGQSNRDIGAELLISTRTVESQLWAVYRKLGVRSRGQLAAAIRAPYLDGG
jgi:DNA-binding NarL/FixJ family response regulator